MFVSDRAVVKERNKSGSLTAVYPSLTLCLFPGYKRERLNVFMASNLTQICGRNEVRG